MPQRPDDELDALLSIGAQKKPEEAKTDAKKIEPAAEPTSVPTPEQSREILNAVDAMGEDINQRLHNVYDDKTVPAGSPAPGSPQESNEEQAATLEPPEEEPVNEEEEAAAPEEEEEAVADEDIEDENATPEQEEEEIKVTVALPEEEEESAGQADLDNESEIDGDQCDGPEDPDNLPDLDETRDEEELVPPLPPAPPPPPPSAPPPAPPQPPKRKEKQIPGPSPRKQPSGRGRTPRRIQQIENRTNNLILALIAAAAVGGGAAALWPDKEPRCSIERPTREQLIPVCNNIPGTPTLGKDLQCKKNGPGFDCTARVEIPSQNLVTQYYRFRLPEVKQSVDLRDLKFQQQ